AADGKCTLRAAVQEANALPGPDTITVPAGAYFLAIPGRLEDAAATGDLDITEALTITGAGRDRTTVDGGALDRVFQTIGLAIPDFSAAIQGITIRNGDAGFSDGGGIFNGNRIALTLDDVAVVNNRAAEFGGGIQSNSFTSSLTITNSVISGNYAYQGGAALNNLGIATVKDTEIIENHDVLGAGAIDSDGGVSLALVKGTVVGNSGTLGTIRSGGELTVVESIVTDNTAAVGGGIFTGGSIGTSQTVVARNTATFGEGGGIYFAGCGGVEAAMALSDR